MTDYQALSETPFSDTDFAHYRFECADLPDGFVVERFEASEALNEPYRLTIRVHAADEATDCYELLGRDVTLAIAMRGSERNFCGIADRITIHHGVGVPSCTVTVVPALSSLSRTLDTRIFQDVTTLDVVARVLGEGLGLYKRSFQSAAVDAGRLLIRNYCVQYRETNLDFVHRLLEEDGIGYYFTHDDARETLVLFDDNVSLARAFTEEARSVRAGDASDGRSLLTCFPATFQRTSTDFTTRDYDWRQGSRGRLDKSRTLEAAIARPKHEIYEHGVGRHHVIHEDNDLLEGMLETMATSLIGANVPAPIHGLVQDLKGTIFDRFSQSNTDDRALVGSQQLQRDSLVFEGISRLTGLSAGVTFQLSGHSRPELDGEYFVTRITHSTGVPPSALIADETAQELSHSNYHNHIHCLPRSKQWRPDLRTRKPRIDGVQTATVTAPPGLDVYTDPFGRIRVQFPWDRAAADMLGNNTCWLRVSQVWAGETMPAFLFIPRVGMEVLVSFLDGDPDRPLVTGCVYNGDNAPPAMLPLQATKSIIRTRTIPFGLGYNELSFEDAMGFERVYLRAERDLSELVQNNHDVRVLHNEDLSVGGSQSEDVGVDKHLHVGRHAKRTVGGNVTETTLGSHTRSVTGTVNERTNRSYFIAAARSLSTRAGGEWNGGGRAVALSAGQSSLRMTDEETHKDHENEKGLTLNSFGSTIHVTQDRIELKVGESSIVITPELVQINGKTLPIDKG